MSGLERGVVLNITFGAFARVLCVTLVARFSDQCADAIRSQCVIMVLYVHRSDVAY